MDSRRPILHESRSKVSLTITSALVSALLEWMLILMLFVDSSFSYLVTKFARYCGLQVPCLLCSRLDHVLGKERVGFYWELICCNHKLDMSSLIFCRLHDNLVDKHGTCESCLFSAINKSNGETNKLRAGKLCDEPYHGSDQGTSFYDHNIVVTRKCSCCNEECIPRTCSQNLSYSKSVNSERDEVTAASTFTTYQRDQASNKDIDPLLQMEYTKIKVSSGTGYEDPFLGNESAGMHFLEKETSDQDSSAKCVPPEPKIITLVGCPDVEKLIHPAPPIKSSNSSVNPDSKEPFGHVSEERNLLPADCNSNASETSEHDLFPEALASPRIKDTHHEEPKDINVSSTNELEKEVHVECGEVPNLGSGSAETTMLQKEVTTKCGDISMAGSDCIQENEIRIDVKPNKTDASTQMAESFDLGDAYKLAVGARGRQLSGKLLEQQRSMDSTRASEYLKLLLSQISARGMECPLYDVSPRVPATSEDFKAVDAASAAGMQILQRRISLERNESNLSFDGSAVSEIDGESVADRLKRQVERDKKIMSSLYRELEEERNASAIAANQAMAMITRLQEEKAALNMEALQCLRMMEEQAEYDDEALQKANDLLAEKEKQIQNFEFELRMYKNQFGNISLSNTIAKASPKSDESGLKEQEVEANYEGSYLTTFNISDKETNDNIDDNDGAPMALDRYANAERITLLELVDEKQIILQYLRKLEEKLIHSSTHDIYPDLADGALLTRDVLEINSSDQLYCTGTSHRNGGIEQTQPADAVLHSETSSEDLSRHKNSQHEHEEHDKFLSGMHVDRDAELDTFRRELLAMNSRLEALEAEQNVIESSINSLEKGSKGFEFIQEIFVRVQELHSAYIRSEDSR